MNEMSNSPEDDIPLPSVGVLSEEESARQVRDDMSRQYTERIKQLEGKLSGANAKLEKMSRIISVAMAANDDKSEAEVATSATFAEALAYTRIEMIERECDELRIAIEESVNLQSHYAKLLNMHDGGHRKPFKDAAEWISRLKATGTIK